MSALSRYAFMEFLQSSRNMTLTLGDEYTLVMGYGKRERIVTLRVVLASPKGINLLIVERHRMLLKQHTYDRKWSGKKIPADVTSFTVRVLDSIAKNMVPLRPSKEA